MGLMMNKRQKKKKLKKEFPLEWQVMLKLKDKRWRNRKSLKQLRIATMDCEKTIRELGAAFAQVGKGIVEAFKNLPQTIAKHPNIQS